MKTQQFAGKQLPLMETPRNPNEPLLPGTEILGGRYIVERKLGEGGMGVVVAARHKALGRRDAIKFLLPQLVTHPEIMARFEREAISVAKLTSPHVARVYDSNFANASEPYIAMEYLDGRDLKSVLRGGPLPIEDAVDYLLQVCHALAEAHENGIVHRDLKPANLFETKPKNGSPIIKVLDFGIAKVLDADPVTDITVEDGKGGFLGTSPYMSPEHLKGAKKVDARTDIWALGVIAYELLTCKKPFHGLTKLDLISKIIDKDEHPEPPHKYRRELPPAIEMVIGRCLAKERNARYQTVHEFEAALREAAGIPAPPPMRPKMPSTTNGSVLPPQADEEKTRELTQGRTQAGFTMTNPLPSRRSKRIKVVLAGGGALATSAAVVGLVVALQRGDDVGAVNASPVSGVAVPGPAMASVTPTPPATTATQPEPETIKIEERTAGKGTPIAGTKNAGSGGKTSLPPVSPAPSARAPAESPAKPPAPKETATAKATAAPVFTPPPSFN